METQLISAKMSYRFTLGAGEVTLDFGVTAALDPDEAEHWVPHQAELYALQKQALMERVQELKAAQKAQEAARASKAPTPAPKPSARPGASGSPKEDLPPSGGAWQGEPASEKQIAMLNKNGYDVKPGITKAEASAAIDKIMANKKGG